MNQFGNHVGFHEVVVVNEKKVLSLCQRRAPVSDCGGLKVFLVADVPDARIVAELTFNEFAGVIRWASSTMMTSIAR